MSAVPATLQCQGLDVPRLGLGTYRLIGDECRRAVADALAMGYRHVDTAPMYDNEDEVGAGMRDAGVPRSDVFLATKVSREDLRPADVDRALNRSLRRLRTDYVDLYMVHWPNPEVPLEETLAAMARARQEGRTRLVGVCNFTPAMLATALEILPDLACDQVEYHPLLGQDELLGVVRRHDMFLTAYSPIARNRIAGEQILQEIAAPHGASVAQVSLAWLLAQDRVVAIPKASSREHLEENLAALDLELGAAEIGAIDLLRKDLRLVDPGWAQFEPRPQSLAGAPRRLARAAWHAARRRLKGEG